MNARNIEPTVSVIDMATNTVTTTIPIYPKSEVDFTYPIGIATVLSDIEITPDGTKLYVINDCNASVSVIDMATNTVTTIIPIVSYTSDAVITQDGTKVYIATMGDQTVSVIDTATNTVTTTIPVGDSPVCIELFPDGTKAYVINTLDPPGDNSVSVIDTATNTVTTTIQVGTEPCGIAFSPDGTKAYVTNARDDTVSVIDTATNTVTTTIPVGGWPGDVAFSPDGTKAYVINGNIFSVIKNGTISVIDTATNTVTTTIPVGEFLNDVAFSPDGTKAYVTSDYGTVSVIDTLTNTVTTTITVGSDPGHIYFYPAFSNPLNVSANPASVTVGTPTDVLFYATCNGAAISGANVTVTGSASGMGTTNESGIAVLNVNATTPGNIIAIASRPGYKNGTTNLTSALPVITATPIPSLVLTPAPSVVSNNSSASLVDVAWKAAPPVASIVLSVSTLVLWGLVDKLFGFLSGGAKGWLQGIYSTWEKRFRKTSAMPRIPFLFGLSSLEMLVVVISALLLGGAFAYVANELFVLQGFIVLVVVAGFTSAAHELAHWYVAKAYKKDVEYKFWGLGAFTLILTSILRYPFSSPSRTIINNTTTMDKKELGLIYLAGPVISILLSIGFLLLFIYGHGLDGIGMIGFNLCIMTCVYQLIPIKPLEGTLVFAWSKLAWGSVFFPSLLLYFGVQLYTIFYL